MNTIEALQQAKLDAEVAYDMFYGLYDYAQLRAMTDAEFEVWKAEAYRFWVAAVDASRRYYHALDEVQAS